MSEAGLEAAKVPRIGEKWFVCGAMAIVTLWAIRDN
jgi:hypothetical protein